MPIEDVFARAARLGHAADALRGGQEVSSIITVADLDHLRALLAPVVRVALPAEAPRLALSDRSESAMVQRISCFVFHDETLSTEDRASVEHVFPLRVAAMSAVDKTVTEVWDVSKQTPVILNFGTLTLADGAGILVRSTVLQLSTDTLVYHEPPGSGGHITLLGRDGTIGPMGDPGPPVPHGSHWPWTDEGRPGTPGNCWSAGIRGDDGGPGGLGPTGNPGGPGHPGFAGQDVLKANIEIYKAMLENHGARVAQRPLRMFVQGGRGGPGGKGGTGGVGGYGGKGGDAVACGCETTDAGLGGYGGKGGPGGPGGTGGPGGGAPDPIIVMVPRGMKVEFVPKYGEGGERGKGGDPGPPGHGGGGGIWVNKYSQQIGSRGSYGDGDRGDPGGPGSPGEPSKVLPTMLLQEAPD
jgi:hypothetical protein